MSKKNKRKFYNSPSHSQGSAQNGSLSGSAAAADNNAFVSTTATAPSTTPPTASMSYDKPVAVGNAEHFHAQEYRVIKHDLIKVVILNALFLAGVLALYYTNLNSRYLERWFGSFLNF